jgi:DNA polymerase-4
MPGLCRDCLSERPPGRCRGCGSPRVLAHPELFDLAIAHIDADAFYASVEKRDDPSLADRPVIVGGGMRGVVLTACYVARQSGVRSAMPMARALRLRPDATVVRPRFAAYAEASRALRRLMEALTPAVEPLSLDEAFLDLSGCARLHGAPPATMLARVQAQAEREVGVTVSVGLAANKFLAKLASELDKPRGFSVIGRAEAEARLAPMPVSRLPGVGPALEAALARDGLRIVADLRRRGEAALAARRGAIGTRLWALAHGRDARPVRPDRAAKSLSAETTLDADLSDPEALEAQLWRLCVKLSDRLKAKGLAGRGATLKLKRADFRGLTRRRVLPAPSQLADSLWRATAPLLRREVADGPWRLIGVGLSELSPASPESPGDLLDPEAATRARVERAVDDIRRRFGGEAIGLGRGRAP